MLSRLVLLLLVCGLAAQAQTPPSSGTDPSDTGLSETGLSDTGLSLEQAQALLEQHSHQLAASQAQRESARLRRQGMQGLGGPSLALGASGYTYSIDAELGLDSMQQSLGGALMQLPGALGQSLNAGPGGLPMLPERTTLHRRDTRVSGHVSAVWPLYTGGLTTALREGLAAAEQDAAAEAGMTSAGLQRQLVERYFDAQLAARALALRERVLAAVEAHDAAAERMQRSGVIAHVERLQARSALADARQQAEQARDAAHLAGIALQRSLGQAQPQAQRLSTPLFLHSQPLPPLAHFIQAAQRGHPGLDKIEARRRQAQSLHAVQQARRRPTLLAFGQHELQTSGRPNWVAGVALRWPLWDSLDRDALSRSALAQVEQAEHSRRQVQEDLALLVEKHWLDVEQARRRYLAQQGQQDLAQEMLRLRQAALQAGTGTALELIDAQTQLAKVQTERAQSAHQYVKALAALLESSAQGALFNDYQRRADIHILPGSP